MKVRRNFVVAYSVLFLVYQYHHCVKRVQIPSFFSLKTDKYGPENSVFGHFSRSVFDVEFDCKKVLLGGVNIILIQHGKEKSQFKFK